jgi:hypothetical protein
MNAFLELLFRDQIELQCEAIVAAAEELEAVLAEDGPPWNQDWNSRVWIAVESMMGATARVSKALWGQRMNRAEQRQSLRKGLRVPDGSVFADVAMRDHFEHFDERLERWWSEEGRDRHADRQVLPEAEWPITDDSNLFRQFDPETWVLFFWGDRFNMREVVVEAKRLLEALATPL